MLYSNQKFLVRLLPIIGLRVCFIGINLVSGALLARVLGQADYGIYIYAVTIASMATIPASLGFDRFLVREVSIYLAQQEWSRLTGLIYLSNRLVLVASMGLAGLLLAIVWRSEIIAQSLRVPISVGLLYIPIGALRSLRLAVIKGLDQVAWSLIPEWVIAPIMLIGIVGAIHWVSPVSISVTSVMTIHLMVMMATLGIGTITLKYILPQTRQQIKPQYNRRVWIVGALPMMILGGLQTVQARIDILMLGLLGSTGNVAIYSAVLQGTQFTSVILLSANIVISARIASLYVKNSSDQLQQLVTCSARVVTGLSCLTVLILVGFGPAYLKIFGDNYVQGWGALAILSLGQLVNAATGSVGVLLNMTGHERHMVVSTGLSAILNVVLNIILIPIWGLNGAALSTTISLIFVNVAKSIWVARMLRINATCFGSSRKII